MPLKSWLVVALFCSAAHAQVSPTPATIMAGIGSPASNSIPCNIGMASVSSTSQYDQRDITAANSIWKCKLATDGVTYNWQAPFSQATTFYTSGGAQSAVKCFVGNVASTATTGAWTISYSSMGISTLLMIQAQALSTGGTYNTSNTATVTAAGATAASGYVTTGTSLLSLGATLIVQPTSTTVYVNACGI